jgi:hypothetical protein
VIVPNIDETLRQANVEVMAENRNLQQQNTALHEKYHTISLKLSELQVSRCPSSAKIFRNFSKKRSKSLRSIILTGIPVLFLNVNDSLQILITIDSTISGIFSLTDGKAIIEGTIACNYFTSP